LIANFGRSVDIREVLLDGNVVAAVMSFYFRDQVLPYYGAADIRCKELSPTSYMYFDQMRWAAESGYRIFDFGRSTKASGASHFKAHWGLQESELPYELLLIKRKELPNHGADTFHLRMAAGLWRCLPPQVAKALGPALVRLAP
jgi:lipid II:glycine glycyltransferase (peptidoglycan interpeptide bridge formation enzyme)